MEQSKIVTKTSWKYKFIMWMFPTTTFWHPRTTCSLNAYLIIGILFSPFVVFEFLCDKLMMLGYPSKATVWNSFQLKRIILCVILVVCYLILDFFILAAFFDFIGHHIEFMKFLDTLTNFTTVLAVLISGAIWIMSYGLIYWLESEDHLSSSGVIVDKFIKGAVHSSTTVIIDSIPVHVDTSTDDTGTIKVREDGTNTIITMSVNDNYYYNNKECNVGQKVKLNIVTGVLTGNVNYKLI